MAPRSLLLLITCLLALLCIASRVDCQELRAVARASMSLDDVKNYALAENREIRQAVFEVNKKQASMKVIMAQRWPKLLGIVFGSQLLTDLNGQYPRNLVVLPGALEPVTQQYRLGMQVNHAALELDSARQNLRLTKQHVVADVKRTFLSAVALKSAITSREQNLTFLTQLNSYVAAQVRNGASLPVDALQSEAQVAQAEYELARDRDELITLGQILNRLFSRDIDTTIDYADQGSITVATPEKRKAIDEALSQRPELKELDLSARASKLGAKIEYSRYIPDVSVGVLGAFSREFKGTFPQTFAGLGFLAVWEPWDWGRRIQQGKFNEQAMRQSLVQLSDKKDEVRVEVDNVRRSLGVAEKQVHAATLKVKSSNEELRVLTKRYQFGSSLFKDVVETQSAFSTAVSQKVAADTNYATVQVDLDRVLGKDFN